MKRILESPSKIAWWVVGLIGVSVGLVLLFVVLFFIDFILSGDSFGGSLRAMFSVLNDFEHAHDWDAGTIKCGVLVAVTVVLYQFVSRALRRRGLLAENGSGWLPLALAVGFLIMADSSSYIPDSHYLVAYAMCWSLYLCSAFYDQLNSLRKTVVQKESRIAALELEVKKLKELLKESGSF